MKGAFLGTVLFLGVMFSAGATSATLIDMSNGNGHVLYDDLSGQYWFWNLSTFVGLTYSEQVNIVNLLNVGNYFGINSWHLATSSDISAMFANSSENLMKFSPSSATTNQLHWSGRYDEAGGVAGTHYATGYDYLSLDPDGLTNRFILYGLNEGPFADESTGFGAWVTSDETTPVPEPASFLLLGAGGAVLVCWRFRKARRL